MAAVVSLRRPVRWSLAGDGWALSREGLVFLQRCAREYGDLVPLRYFWKKLLFVNHPDYIEQVLVKCSRRIVKDVAQRADRALIGDGLFLGEGESWLRQRRLMQPAFHRERIAGYGAAMVACAERLIAPWRDGEERDIYREMSRVTMAIVAQTLFGYDVWGDADEVAAALDVALTCMGERVRSVQVLLPETLPTPTNLRLRDARRRIDQVISRIIGERRAVGKDRGDLLSMLMRAQFEDGSRLSDRQVRDEVMTFLVGGYETAADLLAWCWHLLAGHPEVEARLLAEIREVLGGRTPEVGDVSRLRYAGMVISETLRLYPPAPALGREVVEEFVLGGRRVAKGTDILMSQWVMHRDPRYFAEPEAFRPDRWADGLAERLPRFAYFPFGGGPRLCIGHAFATMEATLVLVTIAQRWRLERVPGHRVVAEMIPTLRPKEGVRMVCRGRASRES